MKFDKSNIPNLKRLFLYSYFDSQIYQRQNFKEEAMLITNCTNIKVLDNKISNNRRFEFSRALQENVSLFSSIKISSYKFGSSYDEVETDELPSYSFITDDIELYFDFDKIRRNLSLRDLHKLIKIAKIESWKSLNLINSGLTEIPAEIGTLDELETLYLSNFFPYDEYEKNEVDFNQRSFNKFTALPEEIGQLRNLRHLHLYGTRIRCLPLTISNLKKLEFIQLNWTTLKDFPEVICDLSSLRELAINGFTSIPYRISELKNLDTLNIPNCKITELPDSIAELPNLRALNINSSSVKTLSHKFQNSLRIEDFGFSNTPLYALIPPEIATQKPSEIFDYIIRLQNKESTNFLYESKMIIVGQGGVGKTCLLKRIIHDSYCDENSTEGIDISKWNFEINSDNIRLNTWDFGGQEIYHATHQFFLTRRSLYIFVWDSRMEEEYGRIEYWLNTIQLFADDSPIILVVNKCDSDRTNVKNIDFEQLKKDYPQISNCFYVSCKDNLNIDNLRKEIQNVAFNLPLMRVPWFSSWIDVRQSLKELSQTNNYINYDDYIKICEKYKVSKDEGSSLIKYLHDLGDIIHFHDDILLRNIVILNPDWGTNAVYNILDSSCSVLKDKNGILKYTDLQFIWKNESIYPAITYNYILKLMENFQLSFEIEPYNVYLIPELLGNQIKLSPQGYSVSQMIHLRYSYTFVPAGIMSRFIVKSHKYLLDDGTTKLCWKKGAYLKNGESFALITLNDTLREKHLDIKVSGPNSRSNRDFIAIINEIVKEIHQFIPKIEFKIMVPCTCTPECTYLHDYRLLLRLINKNKKTNRCDTSLEDVQITELLDGINIKGDEYNTMQTINITPQINTNISSSQTTTATATSTNTISIDIKNTIYELIGTLNELEQDIKALSPEISEDIKSIISNIDQIDSIDSNDDIKKKGILNKLKRFLTNLSDDSSEENRIIKGLKNGATITRELVQKYNYVATLIGLPNLSEVLK